MTSAPYFSFDVPADLNFPRAYGEAVCTALVRAEPEDFQVDEIMALDFDGSGEHLCLLIRKRNQNTRWLATEIASRLDLPESAVGYCGLKDRRAVTTQWFSIHLPNHGSATPYTSEHASHHQATQDKRVLQKLHFDECEILASHRHGKKLRRGMHAGNRFKLRLKQVVGDRGAIQLRLEQIAQRVPNYFGEQRFGIDGQNLVHADKLLRKTRVRGGGRNGIYLSAARSYLFNQILAARVTQHCWATLLPGQNPDLSFGIDPGKATPAETFPDGALWGRGRASVPAQVERFESDVLATWADWLTSLEHCGLSQQRRALVLEAQNFENRWEGGDLVLNFELPVGAYATALLRELVVARAAP